LETVGQSMFPHTSNRFRINFAGVRKTIPDQATRRAVSGGGRRARDVNGLDRIVSYPYPILSNPKAHWIQDILIQSNVPISKN